MLDVRQNIMKCLILSDCNHLVKFILFGDEDNEEKQVRRRYIPTNKLWPGKKFLKDDDLDFVEIKDIKDNEKIIPENNIELAIYHCKGKLLNLLALWRRMFSRLK